MVTKKETNDKVLVKSIVGDCFVKRQYNPHIDCKITQVPFLVDKKTADFLVKAGKVRLTKESLGGD